METHEYALSRGRHASPDRGRCAMEWVARADRGRRTPTARDATSAVAAEYVRHLNDVLADEPRQRLRPYLSRMIGTAGDGLDEQRAWSCAPRLARTCLPAALDAAGLQEHAQRLRFAPAEELHGAVDEARAAAADARAAARERARRACVPIEWSLRRERARAAARGAGRAAALDAARAALTAAAPDAERSALAETAWAAAWDALWAAAWDGRALPTAEALRAGAFDLLDQMLPGELLDASAPSRSRSSARRWPDAARIAAAAFRAAAPWPDAARIAAAAFRAAAPRLVSPSRR